MALSTCSTAEVTKGPMPSPGIKVMGMGVVGRVVGGCGMGRGM